jgi:hypothetical protein
MSGVSGADSGGGSSKKSITIDSLSLSNNSSGYKTKKTKSARKIRPSSIVQPSTLKKTLLERIRQHQRTREKGRNSDNTNTETENNKDTGKGNDHVDSDKNKTIGGEIFTPNFSSSMDFLKKLALKRQQQRQTHTNRTRKRDNNSIYGLSSSAIENAATAKTPEAKMLNQVAETLTNGEIITNTGLIGLPVIYKEMSELTQMSAPHPPMYANVTPPTVNIQYPDYMSQSSQFLNNAASVTNVSPITPTPNIAHLADMYNTTIAAAAAATTDGSEITTTIETPSDPPVYVPEDPTSFLPSIFIKEEPPHVCMKNGTKPTFREWANKMLKKPVDTIKSMFGGDGGDDNAGQNSSSSTNQNESISSTAGEFEGGGNRADKRINKDNAPLPDNVTGMRVKIRKTRKKKFRVGKHDNIVGVLLKNKEAQRHIQKQHLTLKQKTIGEIRKHLYDKNLLKIGSNAPPDVVRRLYEDSILTGDIKNTNKGILTHNFFSSE